MAVMKIGNRFRNSDFCQVFNFRTEESKGCSMLLALNVLQAIGGAITSGALYAAFLAENGIDIVRVGIISFIPYISWILSLFSPMVLAHIKNRKRALLINHVFFCVMVFLATTIMPLLVEDSLSKTIWFAVLLFIGYSSDALIGSGTTAWTLHFIPKGRALNVYVSYSNTLSNIMSTVTGIGGGVVATALAASGNQLWFLFWLRILAFVLFLLSGLLILVVPKINFKNSEIQQVKPQHVITKTLGYRPFLTIVILQVAWTMSTALNGSTFTYYIVETVKAPLWCTYLGSVSGMLFSMLFLQKLRKVMDRTSPFYIMTLFMIVFTCAEVLYVFVHPNTMPLFCALVTVSGVASVGFNLGFGCLFYQHLPEGSNKDTFAVCWDLSRNMAALVGSVVGTWILAQFEARGVLRLGDWTFYGSQMICFIKIFCFGGVLMYVNGLRRRAPAKLST